MGKSIRLEILMRRNEMLIAYHNGEKPEEFVKKIAKKYNISIDSVEKDWDRRKKWLKELLIIEDIQALITQWFIEDEIMFLEAWNLFNEEKNSYIKFQKLIFISKLRSMKAKNLKDMGIFDLIKTHFENKAKEEQLKKVEKEKKKNKSSTEEEPIKNLEEIIRQASEEDIIAIYNSPKIDYEDKSY